MDAWRAVGLNRKNNRFEIFSRGTFPNHLVSIRDGIQPKKQKLSRVRWYCDQQDSQRSCYNRKPHTGVNQVLGTIYKNFEKRDFYKAFLKHNATFLLNTVSNELAKIGRTKRPFDNRI
jgi:hypothetical protein